MCFFYAIDKQGSDDIYPRLPFHRGHLAPVHTLLAMIAPAFNEPSASEAAQLANKHLPQYLAIAISSSLWTASCCVKKGTLDNFSVFKNNHEDASETFTSQAA